MLAPLSLRPLCCMLRVLAALEGPAPEYVTKHTATLVKLLVRLAKEHAQGNPSLILAPAQPQPGQPPRCALPAPCAWEHALCTQLERASTAALSQAGHTLGQERRGSVSHVRALLQVVKVRSESGDCAVSYMRSSRAQRIESAQAAG